MVASPPKRPQTGFFRFGDSIRAKVVKSGFSTVQEQAKEIAKRWNKMGASGKAKFNDAAKKDMEVWREKYNKFKKTAAYKSWSEVQAVKALKKAQRNARKASGKPKRALSAYFLFADDVRVACTRQSSDKSLGAVAKVIGAKWRALADSKKKAYQSKAATAQAKYKVAFKAYQETDEYRNAQKAVASAKARTIKGREAIEKKKEAKKAVLARKNARKKAQKAKATAKKKAARARLAKAKAKAAARKKALAAKKKKAAAKKKAASKKKKAASKKKRSSRKKRSSSRRRVSKRTSKKKTSTKKRRSSTKRVRRRSKK